MPAMTENPFVAHTSQLFPLGHKFVEAASRDTNTLDGAGTALPANAGEREWVYVFNDDPSNAFAQGSIVYRLATGTTTHDYYGATITPVTTVFARQAVIGVAQFAIPVGSYGFVLKKGHGYVAHGTGDITAEVGFTTGGSAVGTALEWADGATTSEAMIGVARAGATAASGIFLANIDCGG